MILLIKPLALFSLAAHGIETRRRGRVFRVVKIRRSGRKPGDATIATA
jgi:hypothetical protein